MLNKEVCQKCIASRKAMFVHAHRYTEELFFQENWDYYRYVYCTPTAIAMIRDNPPDYCPYILEHLINT